MTKIDFSELDDFLEEQVAQTEGRLRLAMDRAMKKAQADIQEIIDKHMVDDYYTGYTPIYYVRSWQLRDKKPVAPWVPLIEENGGYAMSVGIETEEPPQGPTAMNHSKYTIWVKYKLKNGKVVKKKYDVPGKNPRKNKQIQNTGEQNIGLEEKIMKNFLRGVHPRVGRQGTHHIEKVVAKMLDDYIDNKLEKIILSELRKV